ncbi:MAG: cell division protein FtsZ [Haloferacaceae archaeon]
MPYLFIGAGQAGSAIVDDVFGHHRIETLATPLVFNSTVRDLQNLSHVEREFWYGIAERHGLVDGTVQGFEQQVVGGFGRNPVEADSVMSQHADQLVEEFEYRYGQQADIPFVFLFLGLGGGTGCGIAPHIAEAITEYTGGATEIIAVAVLPNTSGPVSEDEETVTASRQAWNTRYGLDRLEDVVDGIVLVDNQRLAYEDAAEGRFSDYNEYVASAVVDLIAGPALERIDPGQYDEVDPPVIDVQDIVTAVSFDVKGRDSRPGYAALGRSVTMTRSLPGYLVPVLGRKEVDAGSLVRLATRKQTVEDADPGDAKKAIGLLRSPAEYISDPDYRIDTSLLSQYMERKATLGEVNMGVSLTKRNLASFTTLFTYDRDDVDRIAEIERRAEEYEDETASLSEV